MECPECGNLLTDAAFGQVVCMPKGWIPSDRYKETDRAIPNHVFKRDWVEGYWDGWNAREEQPAGAEKPWHHPDNVLIFQKR